MKASLDDLHDFGHVERMVTDLKKLLGREERLKKKLDMEVLFLSIAWHDCWKAKRDPRNPLSLWWSNFYEGWGSKKIFKKEAKRAGLDKRKMRKINEAIVKHTWFWKKAKRDWEAKVLWDMDNLDVWTVERVIPKKNHIFEGRWGKKDRFFVRAVLFWVQNFLMTRSEKYLYFKWSKGEFSKRKEKFAIQLDKTINEYRTRLMGRKKGRRGWWRFFSSH